MPIPVVEPMPRPSRRIALGRARGGAGGVVLRGIGQDRELGWDRRHSGSSCSLSVPVGLEGQADRSRAGAGRHAADRRRRSRPGRLAREPPWNPAVRRSLLPRERRPVWARTGQTHALTGQQERHRNGCENCPRFADRGAPRPVSCREAARESSAEDGQGFQVGQAAPGLRAAPRGDQGPGRAARDGVREAGHARRAPSAARR